MSVLGLVNGPAVPGKNEKNNVTIIEVDLDFNFEVLLIISIDFVVLDFR
jgi:hypothetical protein